MTSVTVEPIDAGDMNSSPSKAADPAILSLITLASANNIGDLSIGVTRRAATDAPLADGERNPSRPDGAERKGTRRSDGEGKEDGREKRNSHAAAAAASAGAAAENGGELSAALVRPHSAPSCDGGKSTTSTATSKRRKRHRRQKRRRWKPYYKMSTEERRAQERRETMRAEKMHADRMAHGQPMAPYNTTQFLLEDRVAHNLEPDVDALLETLERERHEQHVFDAAAGGGGVSLTSSASFRARATSTSMTSNGGDASTSSHAGGDEADGATDSELEREFEAEYESASAERLEAMSKQELIQDYMALEHELERANEQLERQRRANVDLRMQLPDAAKQRPADTTTAAVEDARMDDHKTTT